MTPERVREARRAWLAALRSGEYQQGTEALRKGVDEPHFCCLGVACELAITRFGVPGSWVPPNEGRDHGLLMIADGVGANDLPPPAVAELFGLQGGHPVANDERLRRMRQRYELATIDKADPFPIDFEHENITSMLVEFNDDAELDFSEIADILEIFFEEETSTPPSV